LIQYDTNNIMPQLNSVTPQVPRKYPACWPAGCHVAYGLEI